MPMSLKPLIITAIRIMTVSKAIENATLIVTTLSIMTLDNYAEWRSFNCMLIVVMAFVIILIVRAPNYRLFFCQIILTICQITIKPFFVLKLSLFVQTISFFNTMKL